MYLKAASSIACAALLGCASASGSCTSTTMGYVVLSGGCESEPARHALEAHAQRQVSLGERFGPFLLPWVSLRTYGDAFRSSGWIGPFELENDPASLDPAQGATE